MATTIVEQATEKNTAWRSLMAERAERGWDLHLAERQLITKTSEDTYTVPSCTTNERYTVRYGDELEDCTCTDFGMHGGKLACKHLVAVALLYARRRKVYSSEACEVCGVSSSEKALLGIRNDHRRSPGGPRYCLGHHPPAQADMNPAPLASLGNAVLDRLASAKVREAAIQENE